MINNLQLLRLAAAINVVLSHVALTGQSYGFSTSIIGFWKGWGGNGVDLFFVLSGFIMVYTQNRESRSAFTFALNRVIRVVPLYWICTLSLLALFTLMPSVFRNFSVDATHVLYSLPFLSQLLRGENPAIGLGWTLEIELLFYLVFSLSLLARNKFFSYVLLFTTLATLSLWVNQLMIGFVFGMIAAFIYLHRRLPNILGALLLLSGIGLLIASGFEVWSLHRPILFGLPGMLIVIGAANMWQANGKKLMYIGASSYSIYLIQIFTISPLFKLANTLNVSIDGNVLGLLAALFTVSCGVGLFTLIERPVTKLLRGSKIRNLSPEAG